MMSSLAQELCLPAEAFGEGGPNSVQTEPRTVQAILVNAARAIAATAFPRVAQELCLPAEGGRAGTRIVPNSVQTELQPMTRRSCRKTISRFSRKYLTRFSIAIALESDLDLQD